MNGHLVSSQRDSRLTPVPPLSSQMCQVYAVTPQTTGTILLSVP